MFKLDLLWRLPFGLWALSWAVLVTIIISTLVVIMGLLGLGHQRLQFLSRLWARLLLIGMGLRVRVTGRENLERGQTYIFAVNHSSMLDIMVLSVELPKNFRWMAKKNLFKIPFLGWGMSFAGYIPVDRVNRRAAMRSIADACRRIEEGASVVIFPEGTRTPEGHLDEFQAGGFVLAIKTRRPVVPVGIIGAGRALPRGGLNFTPGAIEVRIGKPIPTEGMKVNQRQQLADDTQVAVGRLMGLDMPEVDSTGPVP